MLNRCEIMVWAWGAEVDVFYNNKHEKLTHGAGARQAAAAADGQYVHT